MQVHSGVNVKADQRGRAEDAAVVSGHSTQQKVKTAPVYRERQLNAEHSTSRLSKPLNPKQKIFKVRIIKMFWSRNKDHPKDKNWKTFEFNLTSRMNEYTLK